MPLLDDARCGSEGAPIVFGRSDDSRPGYRDIVGVEEVFELAPACLDNVLGKLELGVRNPPHLNTWYPPRVNNPPQIHPLRKTPLNNPQKPDVRSNQIRPVRDGFSARHSRGGLDSPWATGERRRGYRSASVVLQICRGCQHTFSIHT